MTKPAPEQSVLESRVPVREAGKPLLDYLSRRFRYQTPAGWEERIASRAVTVNGKPARPGQPLSHGDLVSYAVVLKEPPVDTDIKIVHAEPTFVVAVKPGQLPSHADGNFIKNTFIHLISRMLEPPGGDDDIRLVHRLDRETSGLMVVTRDKAAHAHLMRQFAAGTVEKEYLAVAKGKISQDRFEVDGWIGRDPASTVSVRHALVPAGTFRAKHSCTEFARERDLAGATLLRCLPRTGRTNQIRVHLASIGHPVVGDKLYGRTDEEFLEFVRYVKAGGDPGFPGHAETPRHLLHASRLAFDHPGTGKRVAFEAPVPDDMREYMEGHRG
jgi:RluA family pseudouridine synthase